MNTNFNSFLFDTRRIEPEFIVSAADAPYTQPLIGLHYTVNIFHKTNSFENYFFIFTNDKYLKSCT